MEKSVLALYDYGRASVVRYRVRYNLELRPRRALFAP